MRHPLRRAAALVALATCTAVPSAQAQWYGGVDFLLLSPSIPSTGFDNIFYRRKPAAAVTNGSFSDSMEYATRLVLGYEDCTCFGGRVRWFTFDNDLGYVGEWENGGPVVPLEGQLSLDVDAIDFEATQRGSFGLWNILGSAGLRYGRVDLIEPAGIFNGFSAVFNGVTGVRFEGVGPTLALEGRRKVSDTGVSIFASGRSSLLWGDADVQSVFIPVQPERIQDEIVQVWEFQLGLDYAYTLPNGSNMTTGIFWETQRWDSDNNSLGDLSFMGLGIRAGLIY